VKKRTCPKRVRSSRQHRPIARSAALGALGVMLFGAACLVVPAPALAQQSADDLAAAAQNPVAAMISLPFQNNTLFGIGPDDDTANVLNIQPVIPVSLGDWNLINRTIVPIIYLPDLTAGTESLAQGESGGSSFGLGDINHSIYLSPAKPGKVIWGIGPSITLPTATDSDLGSGKWSAGPAAVALTTPKPWVVGTLVRQLWSFAGDGDRRDVSQLLIQPFVNYNLPGGWYLASAPVITANWEADSDDRWVIPIGGGGGKIFRIGSQPVNAQAQAFYNAVSPDLGPDWSLRFQLQFLFPK
jgi:hypothetical protein